MNKSRRVISERLRVEMRDGVGLSVHIHRPDCSGQVPAILSYTPYGKGPLGNPPPIVQHGYATINFDIRGTGDSEGCNDSIYSPQEQRDGYDMIEWAAAQPWCTGAVGMWGISFGAVVSLQMAGAAPPHLKGIIARSGSDDPYIYWTNPGGSPLPYMYTGYASIMTASNFSPPDPAEAGKNWRKIWKQRIKGNKPWGVSFIENLQDGPFWRSRALRGNYARVRCPVFVVDGWADWYPTPLLEIFSGLSVPKRALIGPWSHQWPDVAVPGPRIEWLREAVRWFDFCLKGKKNGIDREPPVTLFVRDFKKPQTILLMDEGKFCAEESWPPARAKPACLYLQPGGGLEKKPTSGRARADVLACDPRAGISTGMHGGGPFNDNWAMPLDQRLDDQTALLYTTGSLKKAVDIVGRPKVSLQCSFTSKTALIAVKLCDVAPDGTSVLIAKGHQNVSYRQGAKPGRSLRPGRIYRVKWDLLSCAYRVRQGHSIRLMVSGADFLNAWPTPEQTSISIHTSSSEPSFVVLPMASPAARMAARHLRVSLEEPEPPKRPARYSISRDVLNDTQTMDFAVNYGPKWSNTASMTVSAKDPACAIVTALSARECEREGKNVSVRAACRTWSDKTKFHHEVDLVISVSGRKVLGRKWKSSVSRKGM